MRSARRQAGRTRPGPRPDHRAWAAAIAVFALLVQALLPAAAMAAQPGGGQGVVICTLAGAQTVYPDQPPARPKGFAGLPCQDCLAAAIAALPAPDLSEAAAPAVFVRIGHRPAPAVRLALARAPPRPPGQGPPTS